MSYQRFDNDEEDGLSLQETNPVIPGASDDGENAVKVAASANGHAATGTHHEIEIDFSLHNQLQHGDDVTQSLRAQQVEPEPEKYKSSYDQIEVEIIGGDNDDKETSDDVIINANDFFLEHNENYTLSWEEASLRVSDGGAAAAEGSIDQDPSRPPVPGWNVDYVKWKTRRIIESIW